MEPLIISALIVSHASACMFTMADSIAKEKGWKVADKIWPITLISWLLYPIYVFYCFLDRFIFRANLKNLAKNHYLFANISLLYVAWIAKIAAPFLVLYIAPWYFIFVIFGAGFLLASWSSYIFFKSHSKTISAFVLIFVYLPVVYLLLN